jgi:uncharacterized protein (TIGR02452 family)
MGKLKYLHKTEEVVTIIKNKSMNLNDKTVDLSSNFDRKDKVSIEYRESDIDKIVIDENKKKEHFCKIVVRPYDSPDAVEENIEHTAILNFASSKYAGGGFKTGAMAQEESLCYRSNLYDVLSKHKKFYEYNREHQNNGLYTDGIIYSSNICFFRNNRLENTEPYFLDIISSAAPNKGAADKNKVPCKITDNTMKRRLEQIIKVAIANNTEHLVLGAFGCGVFRNNPRDVAKWLYELIVDKEYGWYFKQVTFAMHDTTSENSKAFSMYFEDKWGRDKRNTDKQ